jgi:hypothetical protein
LLDHAALYQYVFPPRFFQGRLDSVDKAMAEQAANGIKFLLPSFEAYNKQQKHLAASRQQKQQQRVSIPSCPLTLACQQIDQGMAACRKQEGRLPPNMEDR